MKSNMINREEFEKTLYDSLSTYVHELPPGTFYEMWDVIEQVLDASEKV